MPFDRSAPNNSFTPAPTPFVSAGDAAMRVVADADRWQQRRALAWANEQKIRDALAAVGREVPADAVVVEAAEIMSGRAGGWEDAHCDVPNAAGRLLQAYGRALEEAADPVKWAKRLEIEAAEKFDHADHYMTGAAEKMRRVGTPAWEGKAEQLVDEACALVRGAAELRVKGGELKEQAKAKRWEAQQAARAEVA